MQFATMMLSLAITAMVTGQEREEPAQEPSRKFAVIVNASNKFQAKGGTARSMVKTLFLKNLSRWPDGTRARPYGRKDASSEQDALMNGVLGMSDAELARHWLRGRNMNGTTPPMQIGSVRMVLKHVARHAGGLAVVEVDVARRTKGVRVLLEF